MSGVRQGELGQIAWRGVWLSTIMTRFRASGQLSYSHILYVNKGYNPRVGSAPSLPYHTNTNFILNWSFTLLTVYPKLTLNPSLILCLTYTALVSGAKWRVVCTYILPTSLKTKVDSENAYVGRRRWAAPITPRNHDGATVRWSFICIYIYEWGL